MSSYGLFKPYLVNDFTSHHIILHDVSRCIEFKSHWHVQDNNEYRQVSKIRRTLIGNKIVDHSDVVGASPVGAAPTTSSFST